MRLLLLSLHLEDNLSVRNWYEGFPRKSFSSLTQFIDAFGVDWDYGIEEYEKKAVIDHIWIETFGNDQEHEEVNEDAPFEFKDPDNPTATEMEIGFAPLDLSKFPGYSDELSETFWHAFKGDHDNVTRHVEWFMTLASEYGIKEEEDIYMR